MENYQVFKSGPRKGQPKTKTDKIIRFLVEGLNCTSETLRYEKVFRLPDDNAVLFIGKGSVRYGKSRSASRSKTDLFIKSMERWEQNNF